MRDVVISVRAIVIRVAARVREERERKQLTFDRLASAARVSRSSLIRFEAGQTGIQLETLSRIVVKGLELDWGSFMSTTGIRRSPRSLAGQAVQLAPHEVASIRRRIRSVLRILREAEGPKETPGGVA
jgi:transcriptional regulator with XRE-family HTH domain